MQFFIEPSLRQLKEKLRNEMMTMRQGLGPAPLTKENHDSWICFCDRLKSDDVRTINKMIEKFNLIVPNMNNQMFQYKFEADAEKCYRVYFPNESKPNLHTAKSTISEPTTSKNNSSGFLSSLMGLFSNK